MATANPRTPRTILAAMLEQRELGGQHYGRADELLQLLLAKCEPGDTIELNDGRTFAVVDNFTKDGQPVNKAWKPCGIARFEVREVKERRRK